MVANPIGEVVEDATLAEVEEVEEEIKTEEEEVEVEIKTEEEEGLAQECHHFLLLNAGV